MKHLFACTFLCLILIACKKEPKTTQPRDSIGTSTQPKPVESAPDIYGTYVGDSYHKRNEGYDWVGLKVRKGGENEILISVRSRADQKKPTCTYDTKAFKTNENTFESVVEGKRIIYRFSEDSITISAVNKEDELALYYFCSGGGSIAGTYTRIDGPMDPNQVDRTSFSKVMNMFNVGFNVSSINKAGKKTLTVSTFGLETNDYNETFEIEGERVLDAELEDLNGDGSAELIIFTQSDNSPPKGIVHAFSVNSNKSMSEAYLMPTAENKEINDGYRGWDEYSIIENKLVHRFPVYDVNDSNGNPSGGIRQVSYKLVEGEAMRKFVVDKVSVY